MEDIAYLYARYQILRCATIISNGIALFLYAMQNWNRMFFHAQGLSSYAASSPPNLGSLFQGSLKKWFQILGFFFAAIQTAAAVDNYAVFGIYNAGVLKFMAGNSTFLAGTCLIIYIFRAVRIVTSVFLIRITRYSWLPVWFMGIITISFLVANGCATACWILNKEYPWIIFDIYMTMLSVFIIGVLVCCYHMIWRTLYTKNLKNVCPTGRMAEILHLRWKWRVFVVMTTVCAVLASYYWATDSLWTLNHLDWPNQVPDLDDSLVSNWIYAVAGVIIDYAILYQGWETLHCFRDDKGSDDFKLLEQEDKQCDFEGKYNLSSSIEFSSSKREKISWDTEK